MMKKPLAIMTTAALLLTGCVVSERDFYAVQSQVSRLEHQVGNLKGELNRSNAELAQTKGELAKVKKQRVIRLPTGAPTTTRERNANASNEAQLLNAAVRQYKAGDVDGALSSFQRFNQNYPQSVYREKALFYQGQAAYTARDFAGARAVLEPLVFQAKKVNPPVVRLLKMVYLAQNDTASEARLNQHVQKLTQAAAAASAADKMAPPSKQPPAQAAAPQPANAAAATAAPVQPSRPMRPNLR